MVNMIQASSFGVGIFYVVYFPVTISSICRVCKGEGPFHLLNSLDVV